MDLRLDIVFGCGGLARLLLEDWNRSGWCFFSGLGLRGVGLVLVRNALVEIWDCTQMVTTKNHKA